MCNSSSNWLKSAQNQKKKVLEKVSNFLGIKTAHFRRIESLIKFIRAVESSELFI